MDGDAALPLADAEGDVSPTEVTLGLVVVRSGQGDWQMVRGDGVG